MKRLMLVILLLSMATPAFAGDFAEFKLLSGSPEFELYLSGKVRGKLGWSSFALINQDWAQAYAGPTLALTSWSELGVNVGVESGGARYAETLWLGRNRFSLSVMREHGASDTWYRVVGDCTVYKDWTVGYYHQTFLGDGVKIGVTRGKVTVWGNLLWERGVPSSMVAVKISK